MSPVMIKRLFVTIVIVVASSLLWAVSSAFAGGTGSKQGKGCGTRKWRKKPQVSVEITPPEQETFLQGDQPVFHLTLKGHLCRLKDVEIVATFPSPDTMVEPVKLERQALSSGSRSAAADRRKYTHS